MPDDTQPAHCRNDRLAALLARLDGSSADGERLAALRMLDRELGRAGVSWPELAHRLVAETPRPEPNRRPLFTDPRHAARWIREHPSWRPSPRERDFVVQLADWRGPISEKQFAWLAKIAARLGGELSQ